MPSFFKMVEQIQKLYQVIDTNSDEMIYAYEDLGEIDMKVFHTQCEKGHRWFFSNGLLKWYKPGQNKPERYSWEIIENKLVLEEVERLGIEVGGFF